MVMLYLFNNCLAFDFILQIKSYCERCFHFLKQKLDQRKNEKFIPV